MSTICETARSDGVALGPSSLGRAAGGTVDAEDVAVGAAGAAAGGATTAGGTTAFDEERDGE